MLSMHYLGKSPIWSKSFAFAVLSAIITSPVNFELLRLQCYYRNHRRLSVLSKHPFKTPVSTEERQKQAHQ